MWGSKLYYKINLKYKQKQHNMQNQLPHTQSFPTQAPSSPLLGHKHVSTGHQKGQDRTLPPPNIKHYASNPNISLDIINPKTSQFTSETNAQSQNNLKKNIDFRPSQGSNNYGFGQQHPRAMRGGMSQSLIVGDQNNAEIPQEPQNSKKELLKNMPRKQYRMSQTIDDFPGGLFASKREQLTKAMHKDSNFFKKDSFDDRPEGLKIPSFLNRDRADIMKRSQVVEPTFESNKGTSLSNWSRGSKPKNRKVTVDDFIRIKQLGNGKYGRVYLVKEKYTGFICALKVIEKKLLHQEQITEQFIREVKIQMFLNHANIIKMYGCFDDVANIYIILEVGTGGQLYHQLKKSQPLSESRIAFVMKQVCQAVNEIHSLRIIHRDIKPQNIVLHDNIVKLCDFGWSVHQDNKLRTTFCGTPLYVCPQILKGRQYDQKIDIWSIGIMMYEMVVGQNPFKITRQQELIKIVKDQIKIPSYLFVSAQVRDFLDRCLQKNPSDRATIKELINHAFFKKHQEKNDKKTINM